MKFVGLAREPGVLPGVKTPGEAGAQPGWAEQLDFWRAELERLAREFAAGHAAVDPKRGPDTCGQCGLQPLCRVHEREGWRPAED
jgi:hypothetical protein